jgi:hypothetical protein
MTRISSGSFNLHDLLFNPAGGGALGEPVTTIQMNTNAKPEMSGIVIGIFIVMLTSGSESRI